MLLNKYACCFILNTFLFSGILKAQSVYTPVEISLRSIIAKPSQTNGFSSKFKLSPQLQLRIGKGKIGLHTEFGTGNFEQASVVDKYPELIGVNSEVGNSKWKNSYLALGPSFRLPIGKSKNILLDFSLMGGISFNKSEAYVVHFVSSTSKSELIQDNREQNKTLPIVKPSIAISKVWGNWGLNIYTSWQKAIGEYNFPSSTKDLSGVNFSNSESEIAEQIRLAPILKINSKFPGSLLQFGAGFSYSLGKKGNGNEPESANANINTSRSNIKQQVSKVDTTGNGGTPESANANIHTSRSNIKQQVAKVDSTGNSGTPESANANINTSRSNIKQQVSKVDTTGNGGTPESANANINTSRSNIKQQVAKIDTTGNGGTPESANANINTSRSNIKQQVAKVDTTGNGGTPESANANINTSRSNIKQQVAKVDTTGNDGVPESANANINTSRSNIKQQVTKVDTTGNGGAPESAKANINTSRSNIKQQVAKVDTTENGVTPESSNANIHTSRSNIKQSVAKVDTTGNDGVPESANANINTSRSNIKQQVAKVDSTGNGNNFGDENIYKLVSELKEVKGFSKRYKLQNLNKKMGIVINARPSNDFPNYWVQVGVYDEQRFQPVYNFYVTEKDKIIMVLDTVKDAVISLEEWRKSRKW